MSTEPGRPGDLAHAPAPRPPGGSRPSHPIIARHLAALRDAAGSVLALFAPHDAAEDEAGSPDSAKDPQAPARVRTPLAARIDRHGAAIQRAMNITARLNPANLSRWELTQDVRKDLGWQDQVIRGILDAEVRFWSATIERDPAAHLDETEEAWPVRILQLAAIVGCSPGSEPYLATLRTWRAGLAAHEPT